MNIWERSSGKWEVWKGTNKNEKAHCIGFNGRLKREGERISELEGRLKQSIQPEVQRVGRLCRTNSLPTMWAFIRCPDIHVLGDPEK